MFFGKKKSFGKLNARPAFFLSPSFPWRRTARLRLAQSVRSRWMISTRATTSNTRPCRVARGTPPSSARTSRRRCCRLGFRATLTMWVSQCSLCRGAAPGPACRRSPARPAAHSRARALLHRQGFARLRGGGAAAGAQGPANMARGQAWLPDPGRRHACVRALVHELRCVSLLPRGHVPLRSMGLSKCAWGAWLGGSAARSREPRMRQHTLSLFRGRRGGVGEARQRARRS